MDDVLSSLDVHTARSIADDCFGGPLLQGRTVILITHNVATVGKYAQFFVTIGSDGSISTSESVADAVKKDPELFLEDAAKAEEVLETEGPPKPKKASGKLVMAEEIAQGRVSMDARMYRVLCL